MNHLMLDLETMSTKNNAAITAIGAMFFDPVANKVGAPFYKNINLEDSLDRGFEVDGDTIYWWLSQSDDARQQLMNVEPVGVLSALAAFSQYILTYSDPKKLLVWGNGNMFDNVILRNAFDRCGIICPWGFRQDLDIRTLSHLDKSSRRDSTPLFTEKLVAHNALDDCKRQINWFVPMYRAIKGLD